MLSLLCLDLGTTTGAALRSADGVVTSLTFENRADRWQGGGWRFLNFRKNLIELKQSAGGIDVIHYEEVRRHLSTDAAHAYGGYLAILQSWAEHHQIPYSPVGIGTWKKTLTGRGNAKKDEVLEAVRARGYDPQSQDEADALGILIHVLESSDLFLDDFST